MSIHRRQAIAGLGAGFIAAGARAEADPHAALRAQITAMIAAHDLPGLGFGLVRDGKVAWIEGFGFADREARRPVTPATAFHLASVSKVVTGTAIMQLCEQGRFKLDDPIAPYLDFPVVNPRHPGPVTFRQLFTHTGSLSDRNYRGFDVAGDPTIGLRDFLVGYLTPGGRWYTPDGSYGDAEPGQRFSYSNVGTALVGYLAERIGGASLKAQTAARIFRPLGMTPAAWTLADLGAASRTTPYDENDGRLVAIPPVGYPDWPAGLLRCSTQGMTRFVAAYAAGGALGGVRILRAETVRTMLDLKTPPPLPRGPIRAQGLFWEGTPGADNLVGKFGGDAGANTFVAFDVAARRGVVMLTNRSPPDGLAQDMVKLAKAAVA